MRLNLLLTKLRDGIEMAFIESGKTFDKDAHHDKMKERMTNMDSVQYPLRIPSNIYKKLKVKAAQEGVTIKSVLMAALEDYLK